MHRHTFLIYSALLILHLPLLSHPTGNMISVDDYVLWPYINPVDDKAHHACVMIWREGTQPRILLQSRYPASDFMLYNNADTIYLIERRYIDSTQKNEVRILKMKIGGKPVTIWDWFEDEWRVGEGGFFMPSEDQIIFAKYPYIYSLNKEQVPAICFNLPAAAKRIRAVSQNRLLILGESSAWLCRMNGTLEREWTDLTDKNVQNAPLNRNQIFDATYKNGELLLAYFGKRSFDIITDRGTRQTLVQLQEPLTPHWVAFHGNNKLFFASKLFFNGGTPRPHLLLYKSDAEISTIWK